MTIWLKQSTSVVVSFGPFLDKTDGVTLETGLATAMDNATTGIRLSKNGAAFADRDDATAPAYDAMGCYRITLSTTDTGTLGALRMIFEEAATCLPVWQDFMVVPANVWDSLFGADVLQVDLTQMGGVAQSATDLKDFADAGYDPATNKVQGVVLTDTATTLTNTVTLAAATHTGAVIPTVTTLTNLPAITANWLTAAGLATDAAQEIADTVIARTLTESYAADGVAPTLQQALFLIQQMLTEMSIAGTTMTIKKLDGATTAATLTLNDATTPTSITRAT